MQASSLSCECFMKASLSMDQSFAEVLTTLTVAARGSSFSNARSPNASQVFNVAWYWPSTTTCKEPLSTRKKSAPRSPWRITTSPSWRVWGAMDFTTFPICCCESRPKAASPYCCPKYLCKATSRARGGRSCMLTDPCSSVMSTKVCFDQSVAPWKSFSRLATWRHWQTMELSFSARKAVRSLLNISRSAATLAACCLFSASRS
mmetsp:Transcript_71286/g.230892  ORF Transcript_71286/g.230892 Transcript_71286/m.230892 type:complete len:204 (+) Transcript_71286:566-1177(+)